MSIDAIRKLKDAFIYDLRKPEIDKYDRARIIKSVLDDQDISIRRFSVKYGVPRSTVEDWLRPLGLKEEEFRGAVERLGETRVYRLLRDGGPGVVRQTDKGDYVKESRAHFATKLAVWRGEVLVEVKRAQKGLLCGEVDVAEKADVLANELRRLSMYCRRR